MRVVFLALLMASRPAVGPASMAIDPDTCGQYAEDYTLVRDDVLATLNAADKNLPAAEAGLVQAQKDLRDLKAAADELQRQKTVLLDHITRLESIIDQQRRACEPTVADQMAAVWEWSDAPLAFAAGAGMCVGLAWGLNEVTR